MRTDLSIPLIPLPHPAAGGLRPGRTSAAAREFESQLLGTLLSSVEKSFATIPGTELAGQDDYDYLGTHALASGLASGKGFGIAQFIMEKLGGSQPVSGLSAPASPAPAVRSGA